MKSYKELLTKNNVDEKQLSPALKKIIKDYRQIEDLITKGEAKLQAGKLSDGRKEKLQDELTTARESLEQLDATLIEKVQYWLDNREANKEKGRQLAASRAAKKNPGAAATTPATPVSTEPATQTPPANSTAASTTPATSAANDNNGQGSTNGNNEPAKKKDHSGWIIGGILLTLVGLVLGASYVNSQKQTI